LLFKLLIHLLKSLVRLYEGYWRKFGMDHQNEEAAECANGERKVIAEGKAEVLLLSAGNVFYNPVQEFNRDLRYVHCSLWHWPSERDKLIFF